MDKKIGNILRCIILLCIGQDIVAKSVRVIIQNQEQQQISRAEIGIPFLLLLIAEDFEPREQPKGLESVQGCTLQMYGTSQSSSYINGKQSQRIIFTYVIVPSKKGDLEIGPVRVIDQNGSEIYSDKIIIPIGDISKPEYHEKKPYLLVADSAQKSVYLGQKVTVFLRFCYTQGFDGLSIENSSIHGAHCGYQEQNWQQAVIKLGEHEYSCKQIYFEIYPQELGTLVIPQFKATFMPEQNQQQGMGNLFSLFGFSNSKFIQSHPCGIEVKPLPASLQYSGVTAIGHFDKISFSLNQKQVQVGEGLVAKMVVEGDGNLEVVKAPTLIVPDGLQFYEGNSSIERIDAQHSYKTFEWILQAEVPGTYTIPSQTFTYFDVRTQLYLQLHSESVTFTVDGVVQQNNHHDMTVPSLEKKEELLPSSEELNKVESASDQITYVNMNGLSSNTAKQDMLATLLGWMIGILLLIVGIIFMGWILRPYLVRLFFIQSLEYRWLFWKCCRTKNIQAIYQLFQLLGARYGFELQSVELQKSFHDLGLSDDIFGNWKNFIEMLLEFNFASKKKEEDTILVFHLAKQWFPIILSCCKSFSKKSKYKNKY